MSNKHGEYRPQNIRKQKRLEPIPQKSIDDLCMVLPEKVTLEDWVEILVKPCGVKYHKGDEVYCAKYSDGSCDYLGEKK